MEDNNIITTESTTAEQKQVMEEIISVFNKAYEMTIQDLEEKSKKKSE